MALTDAERILVLIRTNIATVCGVDTDDVDLSTDGAQIVATVRGLTTIPKGARVECVLRVGEST